MHARALTFSGGMQMEEREKGTQLAGQISCCSWSKPPICSSERANIGPIVPLPDPHRSVCQRARGSMALEELRTQKRVLCMQH